MADDLTQAVASSLVEQLDIDVTVLGLGVSGGSLTSQVGKVITLAAPTLDTAIFSVTEALGLKVGAADVRVDRYRCGRPTIVA